MNILLLTITIPLLMGAMLFIFGKKIHSFKGVCIYSGIGLVVTLILAGISIISFPKESVSVISLNDVITISFKMDELGRFFAALISIVWTAIGFYSFEYMKKEEHQVRFYRFYLLLFGVLLALCFAENLVTYYSFFEMLTLGSFALVLHDRTHEAVMAGLKYMFYSFAGAYMVLFGIYFVSKYANDSTMTFIQGGFISEGGPTVLSVALLLMIIGFSVKAGMFPMQAWLPTAHPVAPSPASAALSGIIVKAGALGVIRVIYYVFGPEYFGGTYVRNVVLILSLITILMGSALPFREQILKKRLAYSTVSQVSYILFGIFMINPTSYKGSLIHVAAHACIKSTLFMVAGAIIHITGCKRVDELRGIGRKMPVMMWCYTIVSLGLIGIPPFGGFASKWYLCSGALGTEYGVFAWLGPVILMVSALLTAGYLLPITINAFFPGKDFNENEGKIATYKEPNLMMLIPMIILTVLSVLIGMFPEVMVWA